MKRINNKVQLIGRLGIDPEVREVKNNAKMARFTMATTEQYKNAKGEQIRDTQWHNVILWGRDATLAEDYLHKGSEIAIEGKLVYRQYEDKEGNRRTITEIVVRDLMMLRHPKKN